MPSKIFYTLLGAKLLKISRTTTEIEKFVSSCAKIVFRVLKQGGSKSKIKVFVKSDLWAKF